MIRFSCVCSALLLISIISNVSSYGNSVVETMISQSLSLLPIYIVMKNRSILCAFLLEVILWNWRKFLKMSNFLGNLIASADVRQQLFIWHQIEISEAPDIFNEENSDIKSKENWVIKTRLRFFPKNFHYFTLPHHIFKILFTEVIWKKFFHSAGHRMVEC